MNELIEELKQLIIDSLDLEDVTPADIDPKAPLFGDGLGLDSIDALELGVAVQKRYHVKLDANSADTRQHFHSVENLAKFIATQRG
ncbi:MAG TPA: phosphopantetheine-binding protein [Gammaproteobacteria bacterium]|jgi:acyl carrier protein|nr:phosphopantetheine-binding protein [Gammaproteobacteria bacterium]